MLCAVFALGFSSPGRVRTAQRQYCERGRRYLVEYVYDLDAIVAQRLELGTLRTPPKTHYRAEISVFELSGGGRRARVGKSFAGEYTELGCIEDAPALMVQIARSYGAGLPACKSCEKTSEIHDPVDEN